MSFQPLARETKCASPEEAIALAEKINAAAKHYRDETTGSRDEELANDLIPGACGGYFLSARAYLVRVERKELLAEAVSD